MRAHSSYNPRIEQGEIRSPGKSTTRISLRFPRAMSISIWPNLVFSFDL